MTANLDPREVGAHIRELQQTLLRDDCYIPGIRNEDADDLLRDAQISASHALPECEAENVLSGVSRTVGEQTNCWAAYAADHPTLTLRLAAPAAVRRIQLTFDSNLSREITISINREVLGRQSAGTPPELVCSCRLVFVRDGADVRHIDIEGLWQRRCVLDLEQPILCDAIRIENIRTHGTKIIRIFEARAYRA